MILSGHDSVVSDGGLVALGPLPSTNCRIQAKSVSTESVSGDEWHGAGGEFYRCVGEVGSESPEPMPSCGFKVSSRISTPASRRSRAT